MSTETYPKGPDAPDEADQEVRIVRPVGGRPHPLLKKGLLCWGSAPRGTRVIKPNLKDSRGQDVPIKQRSLKSPGGPDGPPVRWWVLFDRPEPGTCTLTVTGLDAERDETGSATVCFTAAAPPFISIQEPKQSDDLTSVKADYLAYGDTSVLVDDAYFVGESPPSTRVENDDLFCDHQTLEFWCAHFTDIPVGVYRFVLELQTGSPGTLPTGIHVDS